ncbi:hypothetical protein HY968_00110 [Candidatus Kaiserbacteria bacterium]|nr:hypothetical protein [Candidatus Kaiserbacteria bacterium]
MTEDFSAGPTASEAPKDPNIAESPDEAQRIIGDKYPARLVPWGQEKHGFYVVNSPDELDKQFADALADSTHFAQVHVFPNPMPNKHLTPLPSGKHSVDPDTSGLIYPDDEKQPPTP